MEIFDVKKIIDIVSEADKEVLKIYKSLDFGLEYKEDNTPLTLADKVSHNTIIKGLTKFYPAIPVISEEAERAPFKERINWEYFWMVDPLDGTKEFVKRNGEFTINVALIHKGKPVLGVLSAPVLGLIYYADIDKGAFKKGKDGSIKPIRANINSGERISVVKSRSHSSRLDKEILSGLGKVKEITAGSSLKFCYVAEGTADIYLRGGRTMEWDTAAGHCIAETAGAEIRSFRGSSLRYNKKSLLNEKFVCFVPSGKVTSALSRFIPDIRKIQGNY